MALAPPTKRRQKLGQVYDGSELVKNLKAKDLAYQVQIDAVLPNGNESKEL